METSIGQYVPVFLPGECPSLTEKLGRPQSTASQRVQTQLKWSCADRHDYFYLWQLCHSESWAWRWHSCLASGDPGSTKYVGTWTSFTAGVMALSVFFWASCSWWSEGLFGQSFSVAPPIPAPLLCLLGETHRFCCMQLRFVLFHCHMVLHCVQLPPFMFLFCCFECYKICFLMSICVLFVLFYYTLFFIADLDLQ